jgi:hypothetical protein
MKKLSTTAKVLIGVGIAGVVAGGTVAVVSAIKKSKAQKPVVPSGSTTTTTTTTSDKKSPLEVIGGILGLAEQGANVYTQVKSTQTPAAATESAEGKADGGVKFVLKDGIVVPEKN